jgi:hypothetical protein
MQHLIEQYLAAKAEEERAIKLRRELGDQIVAGLNGEVRATIGAYKVTAKPSTNYKVDWPAFDALGLEDPPCKTKRELDQPGLRWYEGNKPDDYRRLCDVITATPGRTQLEIKEIKNV